MLYAFNDANAAEQHETQYFEMFCNRGIYHKGWTAVTRHGVPWVGAYKRAFDDDVWELYDTNTDWTQSKDLAKEHPEKLAEMKQTVLVETLTGIEAIKAAGAGRQMRARWAEAIRRQSAYAVKKGRLPPPATIARCVTG